MNSLESLPRVLRWARRHADMSQRQLARWSGVPKSTIADIESGRCRVHVDTVERLLATMGLEVTIGRQDGEPLGALVVDERRDRAGRRVPPHLDTRRRSDCERVDLRAKAQMRRGRGARPGPAPQLTWRRDREVRDVLRRYGCFGDSPYAGAPRRAGVLDPGVGIADLWLRGWPYDQDLGHAGHGAEQQADDDLRQGLQTLLSISARGSPRVGG